MKITQATRIAVAAALMVTLQGVAQAAVESIIRYTANADPTTQDGYLTEAGNQFWNLTTTGATGTSVVDGGTPAWKVDDPFSDHEEYWKISPTVSDVTLGNSKGWILSTRLRLPEANITPDFRVEASYLDGNRFWAMHFGTDADGDPIVQLFGGPSWTNQLAGTGAYHLYQLKYDPVAANVDLVVDGTLAINNFAAGFDFNTTAEVRWGDVGSAAGFATFYNLVQLEFAPVPEPSVVVLLAAGGLLLAGWRRRK